MRDLGEDSVSEEANDRTADNGEPSATERAKGRLDAARERFEGVAGNLGGRLHAVSEKARGRGARLGRQGARIGKRAAETAARLNARYGDRAEHLKDGYGKARERAERWGDDLFDAVREHPGRGVLAAVTIGFLLGWLLRHRDQD